MLVGLPNVYLISGLVIASEIALPGMIRAAPAAAPDIMILRAAVPHTLAGAFESGPTWRRGERQFLLLLPSIGRFLIEDGTRISVDAASRASDQDVAAVLVGCVLGLLFQQRGLVVLRASAVETGGRAMLFCGPSGAGKSLLAAALDAAGRRFVADNLCVVTVDGQGRALVSPDSAGLRLWWLAIRALGLEERRGARLREAIEKFHVTPRAACATPLPVGFVYLLAEDRHGDAAVIDPVAIARSALILAGNAFRPVLVEQMKQGKPYFLANAAIACAGGVFTLRRPLDLKRTDAVVAALEDHWAGLVDRSAA